MSAVASAPAVPRVEFIEKLQPLFAPHRYKVLYGGRGALKSWSVARALLVLGMQRRVRVLCTREVQQSIKDSVHRLLCDQITLLGLDGFYSTLETEIRGANGTLFVFSGLAQHTVASIKSFEGIDICWIEEAQTVSRKSWSVLIPTIRADESEIWVTFNPELDTDETYLRFVETPPPEALVLKLTYRDNPWFPAVLEQERLHCQATQPLEEYANIWEGECRPSVAGAIYAGEVAAMVREGRICRVPYDPRLKVHTVWDLGLDTTAIGLVQSSRSEIRIIEYIEDAQLKLDYYAGELQKRNYNWGWDWLPHDGHADNVRSHSAYQILKNFGRRVKPKVGTKYPVPNLPVDIGIRAVRGVFPRIVIDREKGARLIECWKRYRRGVSPGTGEVGAPVHDQYSHGADMTRYLGIIADQLTNEDLVGTAPKLAPWTPFDSGTGAL